MYPEEMKRRAIQLSRKMSAGQVYATLVEEFPDAELPDERTINSWANSNKVNILKEQQEQDAEEYKWAHFAHLRDIAEMLLSREVGNVLNLKEDTYTIVEEGGTIDKTKKELSAMILGNIEYICSILTAWEFFDIFVKHLEYENEEIKQDLYKYIKDKPLEFVNIIRTLAQTKEFKGTCPVCIEW